MGGYEQSSSFLPISRKEEQKQRCNPRDCMMEARADRDLQWSTEHQEILGTRMFGLEQRLVKFRQDQDQCDPRGTEFQKLQQKAMEIQRYEAMMARMESRRALPVEHWVPRSLPEQFVSAQGTVPRYVEYEISPERNVAFSSSIRASVDISRDHVSDRA